MNQEQYEKVQAYLLAQGQQELTGHLDGLWQELEDLRSHQDPEYRKEYSKREGESVQEFQDRTKPKDTAPGEES